MPLDPTDLDRLQQVAGRLGWRKVRFELLEGGTRNRSVHVRHQAGEAVVRIAGALDPEYAVAREAEVLAQGAAAGRLLAPRILLDDAASGLLVSEFVPGASWSRDTARRPESARRMGAWLRILHDIPLPNGLRSVDFAASLSHYADELAPGRVSRGLLRRARQIGARLACGQAEVLCHNDLHHLNLIDSTRRLVAVDWEYAGAGAGIMDLAGFVAYHDLEDDATRILLEAYMDSPRQEARDLLADARWLFEAVWWAWLALRCDLEGDEPADLGDQRRRLAVRLAV